jgi:N utilization substance protein A
MEALDVDEMVGQVLASEGFASVEELAYVDGSEISSIDGFDEDTAIEIQNRANEYLDAEQMVLQARLKAGWITEADMPVSEEAVVEEAEA